MENEKLEDIAMNIIANAGGAKSCAMEAIRKAKENDFEGAEKELNKAEEFDHKAHTAHTELLTLDAKGEVQNFSILLTHAQDHFMMGSLTKELAAEIVCVYQKLGNRKGA